MHSDHYAGGAGDPLPDTDEGGGQGNRDHVQRGRKWLRTAGSPWPRTSGSTAAIRTILDNVAPKSLQRPSATVFSLGHQAADVSLAKLDAVARRPNERPRKKLGCGTPAERYR